MSLLVTNLIDAARQDGDRPAVKLDDAVLTYQRFLDAAFQVAALLRDRGVEPGDRVGVCLPNVPAYPVYFYGTLLAGGVVLPLNPLFKSRELEYCLRDSGARLVIGWERGGGAVTSAAEAVGIEALAVGAAGLTPELLAGLAPLTDPIERTAQDDAVLIYTSGMTGEPMGARLTNANLSSNAATSAAVLGLTRDDVMMGCLPLFHVFGLTGGMNAAVSARACLTLIPRFHPAKALEVIGRDRVTIFEGVPTMYAALMQAQDPHSYDVSTLRTCVSGGSAMPVELMRAFEGAFGCIILEGYGLTETSPVATFNHADAERKPGSIGTPVAGMQLKLIDSDGADIPEGDDRQGEIVIRGEGVMQGYWQRPAETATAIPDSWFRTGDLAVRDRDGYYFITGRKKDMIIRGGYNVYPREIEDALTEHSGVAEAVVIGLPHPDLGEEVAALVVLAPESEATVEELRNFAKERVAAYKYPRHLWIVDNLPRDASGSIMRREVVPPSEVVTR